ncbi:hypothetical protein C0995_008601 [Termitomyces sp. Mi166|nr:hypothetical protein C0995_008601 [Termitomyces sp. Mi166\
MQFKSLFILASLAVSVLAQTTVATVQDDINNKMGPAVNSFSAAVHGFSIFGGTVEQAMTIHTSAKILNNVIVNTTNDINSLSSQFSLADSQQIFGNLQALEPSFLQSVTGLIARKLAFEFLPLEDFPVLIEQDLEKMKTSADNFLDALTTHVPTSVQTPAGVMKSTVDSVFSIALDVYDQ